MIPTNLPASCWVEIDNQSETTILVRKYKKFDFLSQQRIFHPKEAGIVTEGANWDVPFIAKLFTIDIEMKTKLLLKITVNRMYKVTLYDGRSSCQTINPQQVDMQLIAHQRMEEIWEISNYYETLRIPRTATQREIRIAYLKLALQYHPDHNSSPHAPLMFERIAEAYNTLSDDEIRRKYDAHLRTDSGIFSKSYWRQVFCVWNRDKACQVGISTFLTLAGAAILLTSLIAAPTGVGIPISVLVGALGSGIFAAGVGGLSISVSRKSAIEDNKLYDRWLRYTAWYGIAGSLVGGLSAGISSVIAPAVGGGLAGFFTSAAVNGAVSGAGFSAANGIASSKWKKLLTRLRVDAIALDLALGALTGAATGIVFQGVLTSAKALNVVTSQAEFSAKSFMTLGGIVSQKSFRRKNYKKLRDADDVESIAMPIDIPDVIVEYNDQESESEDPYGSDCEELKNENSGQKSSMEEDSLHSKNHFINYNEDENFDEMGEEELKQRGQELSQFVLAQPVTDVFIYHNLSKFTRVRMFVEFTITDEKNNTAELIRKNPAAGEMLLLPPDAQFLQVYFEYSPIGIFWKPICDVQDVIKVFTFEKPATRRFFVSSQPEGYVAVSQIRDEFEQCEHLGTLQ